MSTADAGKPPAVTATYESPASGPFSLSKTLPSPSSLSPDPLESRKTYLKELRQATCQIQEQVNKELTARMEEDKARDSVRAGGETAGASRSGAVDDVKEEENYGEEVQEEE